MKKKKKICLQLVVSWIFRFVTFFTDFLDKLGQGLSNLYLNGQPALSGLLPIPLRWPLNAGLTVVVTTMALWAWFLERWLSLTQD